MSGVVLDLLVILQGEEVDSSRILSLVVAKTHGVIQLDFIGW